MTELQVEYLLKSAETLNFSKAAEELHVTQPSVSFQISNLEKELGIHIFDRSKKSKLSLTPAGKLLLDTLVQIRSQLTTSLHMAHALENEKSFSVRIGIAEAWDLTELIEKTKKQYQKVFPKSEIIFEAYCFSELIQKLDSNRLDAILTVQTTIPSFEKLTIQRVGFTKACLLYSCRHPLKNPEKPQLSDFSNDVYFVLPQTESPLSTNINYSYFLSQMMHPTVETLPNQSSMLLHIGCNEGYGIFDSWTRYRDYPDIESLELDSLIPICLAKKMNTHNPLIDLFYKEAFEFTRTISYKSRQTSV